MSAHGANGVGRLETLPHIEVTGGLIEHVAAPKHATDDRKHEKVGVRKGAQLQTRTRDPWPRQQQRALRGKRRRNPSVIIRFLQWCASAHSCRRRRWASHKMSQVGRTYMSASCTAVTAMAKRCSSPPESTSMLRFITFVRSNSRAISSRTPRSAGSNRANS